MGLRKFARLVLVVLVSVSLFGGVASAQPVVEKVARAETKGDKKASKRYSSEYYLPANTRAWVSIPDLQTLNAHLDASQMGLLSKDPALQPFIKSARKQMRNWMDDRGVKFEFAIEDFDDIKTGEISIAGILPEAEGVANMAGTHGIVFLVDGSQDIESVNKLINQVDGKLSARGAVKEMLDVNGIAVTKWIYPEKRKWAKRKRVSYQAVADGWFLVSDNDVIFRQVLRRVVRLEDPKVAGNLASQESFRYALSRCVLGAEGTKEVKADVRWFVEPFGYVKLARAIEIENEPVKRMEDDWTAVLAANGLKAIRSVAGSAAFASDDKEAFFRFFVHAPKKGVRDEAEARMLRILDFSPFDTPETTPPAWVPATVSGSFTAQWDFSKAFDNIGPIIDSFLKEEGAFKDLIDTVKNEPDFRVDIPKLIGQLDKRFTVISETTKPLGVDSEKLAVGFKLVDNMNDADKKEMIESIQRAIRGKKIVLGGFDVIVDDRTEEDDDFDDDADFNFDGDDLPFEGEEENDKFAGGGAGAGGAAFALFEKKFIGIAKGYLFISNDKDYLKSLLTKKDDETLSKQQDFIKIRDTIAKYVDLNKVRATRFSRIDKVFELNYHLIKKGELATSKSLMGKVVSSMLEAQQEAEGAARDVKVDVSKLPDDYNASIAKYLGRMGWMTENEDGGWRFTGVVLKK